MDWVYNSSTKEAVYCYSSPIDPPLDADGNPWPCHGVPQRKPIAIEQKAIPAFQTLTCPRFDGSRAITVSYDEVKSAIAGGSL